jgi:hypothetical protein
MQPCIEVFGWDNVTGYGVAKRKPDDDSWIREPDLFA